MDNCCSDGIVIRFIKLGVLIPPDVLISNELREDGGFELREDGGYEVREVNN